MHLFGLSRLLLLVGILKSCTASEKSTSGIQIPLSTSKDESPLLALHRNLVSIQSITENEHEVGEWLVSYLHGLNYTTKKQVVISESSTQRSRFNILAYKGDSSKTRAIFSSHIDTVPPFYSYELRNEGKEIWGRGSVDAKACVAAQVQAFHELHVAKKIKDSDLGLLFVVGEETGGDGMTAANDLGLEWEAVIFGEPTEGKLASGHKGLMSFHIYVNGTAAHSGYPWLGQSANEILVAALADLARLKDRNGTSEGGLPASEKYGASTLNIGKIEGGVAANVVAEHAAAKVSVRLAGGTPEESRTIILETIKNATDKLLEKNGKKQGSLQVKFTGKAYAPVDIDTDVDGFDVITVNYGTDVPNLKGKHKRYLYGPGSIQVAHSDHEHLKVSELYQAVEDYKKLALNVLKH